MEGSEILREALRDYLKVQRQPGERPAARVRRLIGSLETGIPDLTEKHQQFQIKP